MPDEVVDRGSPRSLPDSTAGIATWLDARRQGSGGDLTRKRSLEADGRRSIWPGLRAITGPLATVSRSHSRLLRSSRVSSSAGVTAVRHTPSKLVMRVRFPSPALRKFHFMIIFRSIVHTIATYCALARVLGRLLACSLAMSRQVVVCPGVLPAGEDRTLVDRRRGEHMTLGSRRGW